MRRPRLLAAAVAGGLLLLPVAAGAEDEPGSAFDSYQLLANAPGIGLDGLYRDVAFTVPEVTSSLRTGAVGAGLASLAWPGPVIGNGGSTLLVLSPQLPPETVMLNSPVRAEARTGGTEKAANNAVPGTVMAATAKPDQVTADASFDQTGLPVGSVGAMTSASKVALQGAGKAVATSRTTAQDVSLAGGVITLGSVTSTASATSDGVKGVGTGGTTVSGMEVAGVPVTVDGHGIHVQGQTVPNPLPAQTVDDAIKALGLEATVTQPRTVTSGGGVTYQAGALVLVYTSGGDQYSLTFGRASASIAAVRGSGSGADEAVGDAPAATDVPAVLPRTDTGGAPPVSGGGGAAAPEV
ncbi:MAG: hypothetical protein JWN17_1638, partial [Frankiales bacterium]|nr:hypothetical protein [Frankiales bacterium]